MANELQWRLSYRDSRGAERAAKIAQDSVLTIGRSANSDVVVDDASMSRSHFSLSIKKNGIYVEDLGSSNGIFIAGARVSKAQWKPGDLLKAGTVEFAIWPSVTRMPTERDMASPTPLPTAFQYSASTPDRTPVNPSTREAMSRLRVFISYSRRDSTLADRIVSELESRDFSVTIDRRDLPFGEEWRRELDDLIRYCDVVLFLISEASLSSQTCRWELGQARSFGKRLLPVAVGPWTPSGLPPELSKVHILPGQGVFTLERHCLDLVKALQANSGWVKEHSRLFDRASEWIARGEPNALLLRGPALRTADLWAKRKPQSESISYEITQLIARSRLAVRHRWTAWVASGSVLAAVGVFALVLFSNMRNETYELQQRLADATRERDTREKSRVSAEKKREQARDEARKGLEQTSTIQDRERVLAEFRRVDAALQVQTKEAEAARLEAARLELAIRPAVAVGTADPSRRTLSRLANYTAAHGTDLQTIKYAGLEACTAACRSDTRCTAYSYDKWNRWCFLKDQVPTMRYDPQYVSGVLQSAGNPPFSQTPKLMERYRNKSITDDQFETRPATNFEACENVCRSQETCAAVTFFKTNRECRLFSEPGEYFADINADTSVKRQTQ